MIGLEAWAVIADGDLISGHTTRRAANAAAYKLIEKNDHREAGVYQLVGGFHTVPTVAAIAVPPPASAPEHDRGCGSHMGFACDCDGARP